MMVSRTWRQRLLQGMLAFVVVCSPLAGNWLSLPLFALSAGILLAYEGISEHIVFRWLAVLIIVEIVSGMQLGTVSLAWVLTVLVMKVSEQFIGMTPLSRESGWQIISLVRATIVASILAGVMMSWSLIIQSMVYHQGAISLLGQAIWHPILTTGLMIIISSFIGLMLLHRIDVPFHRAITFGR